MSLGTVTLTVGSSRQMSCLTSCCVGVRTMRVRSGTLAVALLAAACGIPDVTRAECVQQMSRLPIAAPAAAPAPAYRANMARARPAARAVGKPARPRVAKAAVTGVRKARPVRKASAHRVARKPSVVARRAAKPVAPVRAYPTPTPMPVAARELATPLAYALIASEVCETGPSALVTPPRLAMARTEPDTGVASIPSDTDTGIPGSPGFPGTDFPGTDFPDGGVSPGGPGTTPVTPPVTEPPVVGPPVVEPPVTEPPVTQPPVTEPPVVGPPVVEPPIGPPGVEPPVVGPPPGPPTPQPPITTPVPEPGTWALMILGFGLLGARLRATSSARSRCRDRADRLG